MPKLSQLASQLNLGDGWSVLGKPAPAVNDDGVPTPGQYTVVLSGPGGATRRVALTAQRPPGPYREGYDPIPDLGDEVDFTIVDVEKPQAGAGEAETNARIEQANAARENARVQAAQAQQQLADLQAMNANRAKNQQNRGLFMTDEEIAQMDRDLRSQGLTDQDIKIRQQAASDNARNTATANEIASQNAATNAFVAAENAKAQAARIGYEEGMLGLNQAQEARVASDNANTQRLAEDKLKLDQLTQRQANEIQERQNQLRGAELEQRGTSETATLKSREEQAALDREQRAAEAQQTGQNQLLSTTGSAAASLYGAERQAQSQGAQTGAGLLQNRGTLFGNLVNQSLSNLGNFSQGSAGRYGMIGGGLQGAPPPGAIANIVGGAFGASGEALGGQSVLDTAARMVNAAAPGAALSPQGQAAMGVITQMIERYQALNGGQPPPQVQQTQQAAQAAQATQQQGGGLVSPGGNASNQPSWPQNQPGGIAPSGPSPTAAGFQAPQTAQLSQWGPIESAAQSVARANPFKAPTTITINA